MLPKLVRWHLVYRDWLEYSDCTLFLSNQTGDLQTKTRCFGVTFFCHDMKLLILSSKNSRHLFNCFLWAHYRKQEIQPCFIWRESRAKKNFYGNIISFMKLKSSFGMISVRVMKKDFYNEGREFFSMNATIDNGQRGYWLSFSFKFSAEYLTGSNWRQRNKEKMNVVFIISVIYHHALKSFLYNHKNCGDTEKWNFADNASVWTF